MNPEHQNHIGTFCRSERYTDDELEFLLQEVHRYSNIIESPNSHSETKHRKALAWQHIAKKLEMKIPSENPKTALQLRNWWKRTKSRAKQRYTLNHPFPLQTYGSHTEDIKSRAGGRGYLEKIFEEICQFRSKMVSSYTIEKENCEFEMLQNEKNDAAAGQSSDNTRLHLETIDEDFPHSKDTEHDERSDVLFCEARNSPVSLHSWTEYGEAHALVAQQEEPMGLCVGRASVDPNPECDLRYDGPAIKNAAENSTIVANDVIANSASSLLVQYANILAPHLLNSLSIYRELLCGNDKRMIGSEGTVQLPHELDERCKPVEISLSGARPNDVKCPNESLPRESICKTNLLGCHPYSSADTHESKAKGPKETPESDPLICELLRVEKSILDLERQKLDIRIKIFNRISSNDVHWEENTEAPPGTFTSKPAEGKLVSLAAVTL